MREVANLPSLCTKLLDGLFERLRVDVVAIGGRLEAVVEALNMFIQPSKTTVQSFD